MTNFTPEALADAARFLEGSVKEAYGPPKKSTPKSNNAAKVGHPCAWYLWALRARNEDLPTPDDGLPGVWAVGRENENAVKIHLLSQGWHLVRTEVMFEDQDLDIRGKLDWELSNPTHPFWQQPIPTEFKSCSPNYWPKLMSFDDCFESPMSWVRLWPIQALVYSYLVPEERPYVCLLLRNKVSGAVRAIVERTEDHFDRLVKMNEVVAEVNTALASGEDPTCMPYDPVWCKKCDAKHICPTMQHHAYGSPTVKIEDPSVIDSYADRWDAGQEAKKESTAAWEEIKDICRHYGLYKQSPGSESSVIGGRWVYTVKISKSGTGKLTVTPLVDLEGGGEDG
jgi:hypothetical protein